MPQRIAGFCRRFMGRLEHAVKQFLIGILTLYRCTLSPILGHNCRFEPTCSRYALEAIQRFGPWRGSWLALRRLFRCHPFAPGGLDPVPDRTDSTHG